MPLYGSLRNQASKWLPPRSFDPSDAESPFQRSNAGDTAGLQLQVSIFLQDLRGAFVPRCSGYSSPWVQLSLPQYIQTKDKVKDVPWMPLAVAIGLAALGDGISHAARDSARNVRVETENGAPGEGSQRPGWARHS